MHDPRVMTRREQADARTAYELVETAHRTLLLSRVADEDVEVARARLGNWLIENARRWTR